MYNNAYSSGSLDNVELSPDLENQNPLIKLLEQIRPPTSDSFGKLLWELSITRQSIYTTFFKGGQAAFFIFNNIIVNIFSFHGNFNRIIPEFYLNLLNINFGIATFFSNLLSKVTELIEVKEGLNLKNQKQIIFQQNLQNKIEEETYFPESTYMICLRESDFSIFYSKKREDLIAKRKTNIESPNANQSHISTKLKRAIIYAQDYYRLKTGKTLEAREEDKFEEFQDHFYENNLGLLIVVSSFDLPPSLIGKRTRVIRFYKESWLGRIYNNLQEGEKFEALITTSKASLALFRWTLLKGFPGLVVLLTGIHALSKVFGTEKIQSRLVRFFCFTINFAISFLGKTIINNKLKGDAADRECRKLTERLWHRQPLSVNLDRQAAIFAIIVNLFSQIPYAVTTAFFYTAEGMQTTFDEFNSIFDTSIALSEGMRDCITYLAVLTSIPAVFVTSIIPCYDILKEFNKVKANNQAVNTELQKFFMTWCFFIFFSILDSVVYGNNAYFNCRKTLKILQNKFPALSDHTDYGASFMIATGVTILAIFFCVYKARPKFPANITKAKDTCSKIKEKVISFLGRDLTASFPAAQKVPFIDRSNTPDKPDDDPCIETLNASSIFDHRSSLNP